MVERVALMKSPGYAVVIVTYNRKKLLCECVHRVIYQTVPADKIIIVNNASTDGTKKYLEELSARETVCEIIECPRNIGGAGGFAKGISRAFKYNVDCVLMIDDDAMLAPDYMEKLLKAKAEKPAYSALAGSVKVNGNIDTGHRKKLSKAGMFFKDCAASLYQNAYFECDIASFCGMLLDKKLMMQIGLPHEEYFIWHDDAEYSLRIRKHSRFLVIPDAVLDHMTEGNKEKTYPRRYNWRDYYNIRNRLLLVEEHGGIQDKILNHLYMFLHIVCRNWLFGFIRAGKYDWEYEKHLVRKAYIDARSMQSGRKRTVWKNSGICIRKESHS